MFLNKIILYAGDNTLILRYKSRVKYLEKMLEEGT